MDNFHISLSSAEQAMVDEQIAVGGYASADDYVAALVREDARKRAREKLEAMLTEGLDSGDPTPWTDADVERLRELARRPH